MKIINLFDELQQRGFIYKISDTNNLSHVLLNKNINLYCGFDPTSDSLHIGHLLPLLCLCWFQKYQHNVYIIIGHATSFIGDPSFKKKNRLFNNLEIIQEWGGNIKEQINIFFTKNNLFPPIILNNYHWFQNLKILPFLRDIGKFFSINKMISRTAVKDRITRIDQGISFTEFSYNLLQSYDFLQLYQKYQVILQIGGSDQWGNISSGIHLIKKIYQKTVFGLTVPLLMQNNGIKFGKTENNTMIWLDSKKTSPYSFYQFWLNIHDDKVLSFLKLFTFLNLSQIDDIYNNNNIKIVKILLADHITKIVHGKESLNAVKRITKSLFSGNMIHLQESDLYQLKQDGIPSIILNGTEDLRQSLVNSNLSSSRSDAYRLIISNSIKINGRKELNPKYKFNYSDKLFNKFTILSKGKKKHCVLCW